MFPLYEHNTTDLSPAEFELVSPFQPAGDQPEAIAELVKGLKENERNQVLLGITGSGKTFTMAQIIQQMKRPALILAHNKILAAQLYGEMKTFFPNNAVEYFVSYYDYYQPEAYIPRTDTYIEKDSAINEQNRPNASFCHTKHLGTTRCDYCLICVLYLRFRQRRIIFCHENPHQSGRYSGYIRLGSRADGIAIRTQ